MASAGSAVGEEEAGLEQHRVQITLLLLSGEHVMVDAQSSDTLRDVKQLAATQCSLPVQFLEVACNGETIMDERSVAELQTNQALNLVVRESVPFVERDVPEGSTVRVDGVPAIFGYHKGNWSSKLQFVFNQGQHHPEFGAHFQVKDWMQLGPGIVHYRNCTTPLKVDWVLPKGVQRADSKFAAQGWDTVASSMLVRQGAELGSDEVMRLKRGAKLVVEEGLFLPDDDRTPRLRISSPVSGWVTPYLASKKLAPARCNLEPCWPPCRDNSASHV